jgi:hypothetical protein
MIFVYILDKLKTKSKTLATFTAFGNFFVSCDKFVSCLRFIVVVYMHKEFSFFLFYAVNGTATEKSITDTVTCSMNPLLSNCQNQKLILEGKLINFKTQKLLQI